MAESEVKVEERIINVVTEPKADITKTTLARLFNEIKNNEMTNINRKNQDSPIKYPIPLISYWDHIESEKGAIFTNGIEYVPANWFELAKLLIRFHDIDIDNAINAALDWAQELTRKIFDNTEGTAGLEKMAEEYNAQFFENDVIK